MKKYLILIIVAFCINSPFAKAEENPIKFYVPSRGEVNAYINLQKYLAKCESSVIEKNDQVLWSIFELSFKYNNIIQTYLIEAFLRNTKNISIQNAYLEYLKSKSIETDETKKILLIWGKRTPVQSNAEAYKLANDEIYEYINLTGMKEIGFFDNNLYLTIPNNKWNIMSIGNDSQFLIYGGGTNSVTISIKKYDFSIDDSKHIVEVEKNRFPNEVFNELEINDFLKLCNSEYMVIKYGCDNVDGIYSSANIDLYLYSKKSSIGYKISYFMNFSDINILADEAPKIYSYLAEMILFSWVE